ncbi:hypothetical protein [Chitinophaga sp. YR627]|uniref:hypothetical protein n=1 Tax=Chitinophaga sp. YR627 TaxID=1881041 RepID=UPI0015A51B20|nr:hypothetical protein [Chitinophaga sp. YR627]
MTNYFLARIDNAIRPVPAITAPPTKGKPAPIRSGTDVEYRNGKQYNIPKMPIK